jgi:hypothetical protein
MTILITRTEIQQYKQISNSIYDDKLKELTIDAQFNDIQPLLGERLFSAVLNDPSGYSDLLNGSSYTYAGITYTNYGLKSVLANYIYARYAMFGDAIDNPFGITNKLSEGQSKPLDYSFKKNLYSNNRSTAFNYWKSVESFLIRTKEPLFNCANSKVNNTFKISKIG